MALTRVNSRSHRHVRGLAPHMHNISAGRRRCCGQMWAQGCSRQCRSGASVGRPSSLSRPPSLPTMSADQRSRSRRSITSSRWLIGGTRAGRSRL